MAGKVARETEYVERRQGRCVGLPLAVGGHHLSFPARPRLAVSP